MTLRHLEIFLAIYEHGTMNNAAKHLNVSQPAISKAISELENYYEVLLFERVNRKLVITPAGETLLTYAYYINDLFNNMESALKEPKLKNYVRIGASMSVGTSLLPKIVFDYKKLNPNFVSQVIVDNTTVIESKILDATLDLAIVEGEIQSEYIDSIDLKDDELVIVARKEHPLSKQKTITLKDLESYSLISREVGSHLRNQLDAYLKRLNIYLYSSYSCSSVEAIKQALIYSDGIAFLSKLALEDEFSKKHLIILPIESLNFQRKIKLIFHKNKMMTSSMNDFCRYLENKIK